MCHMNQNVRYLEIFCDSACGQNKNWTVFRLMHYIVDHIHRLHSIKITFPIRGHSYLECDKNSGLVNQHKRAELPDDWIQELQSARQKPCPFTVTQVDQSLVRNWSALLEKEYLRKCPFATRPVKEIVADRSHPRFLKYRTIYNGAWEERVVNTPGSLPQVASSHCREFILPEKTYKGPLPVSKGKYKDLQQHKKFCGEEARGFYEKLSRKD
ncbi:hypothetical protein ANN_05343 [Periplaneta americana]|uniref:Uncharacterized protein n=1 Tax=Periplaneta americana TaxID=6978 RepID=A0ABQ8TAW6_PERAM|nr:hypothetical protein ANN_05343 [Periplaneta americana]